MVVMFFDGVDGTGKTTLLHAVAERLARPDHLIAAPLRQFLPAIDRPEAFAHWVTSTQPEQIEVALLDAQTARVRAIPVQLVREPGTAVLADRGPRPSPRPHLPTSTRPLPTPASTPSQAVLRCCMRL